MDNPTPGRLAERKGYFHLAIAAITCPCHVPIYLAILSGTALGAFLQENLLLFILALTGIFLLTLSKGLKLANPEMGSGRVNDGPG